jgi:putative nucleotidyltransferase with HDIG domain
MKQPQENLVLIVDDEPAIRDMISKYLTKVGFATITASNGVEALELFIEKSPQVVITDIKMPSTDGLQFLKNVRKFNASTPVIFITGFPDMNTVIEAIHYGAYDYIIKPFRMEAVHSKVSQAINAVKLTRENLALTRLASLHDISYKMTNTHEVSKILDETFKFCLNVIKADSGAILLLNRGKMKLEVVRKKGVQPGPDVTLLSDEKEWPLSKWCINSGKSLTVTNGETFPEVTIDFPEKTSGSIVCIPLRTHKEIIGAVSLNRKGEDAPFTELDRTMMEVISAQAGTAINNARLYTSLSEKVSELSLISSYSEQFVGLVDLIDVIRCLFETVLKNFPIDVIGFLVVKKRFHDFLYWSRGKLPDKWVNMVIEDTISEYNKAAKSFIVRKRVKPSFLEIVPSDGGLFKIPLVFKHTIPLIWEDLNIGALFLGAKSEPENKTEQVKILSSLVNQTRIALTSAMLYSQMKENYIRTIKALAIAVDAKDTYTHGHSENVMNIAEAIAEEMRVDSKTIGVIRDGGLLHDIGKIGIPGYILNKPGPLTREEFDGVMKTHSTLGANIVKEVPFLQDLYSLILHHHEHHDGSGYPDGLKGEEIPLGARILHVADAFEAMTSHRPYRDSLGKKEAVKRLLDNRGKEFDPHVVEAFMRIADKRGWLKEEE